MKLKFLLLLVLASVVLSSCAAEPDDKDFYYRGWTHPQEREDGMQ